MARRWTAGSRQRLHRWIDWRPARRREYGQLRYPAPSGRQMNRIAFTAALVFSGIQALLLGIEARLVDVVAFGLGCGRAFGSQPGTLGGRGMAVRSLDVSKFQPVVRRAGIQLHGLLKQIFLFGGIRGKAGLQENRLTPERIQLSGLFEQRKSLRRWQVFRLGDILGSLVAARLHYILQAAF